MAKVNKNKSKNKTVSYFDYNLLFIIIFLIGFGLVMLYSTSSYAGQVKYNDAAYFLKKQFVAYVIGFVCMTACAFIDYHIYQKFFIPIYLGGILSLFLVLTPLGVTINGARRWINVGFSTIQPAEIMKLSLIIAMAAFINEASRNLKRIGIYVFTLGMICVPGGLIYLITDNLSSAIIVIGIGMLMLFIGSPDIKKLIYTGLIGLVIGGGLFFAVEFMSGSFRFGRVIVWLHPEEHAKEGGFQVLQALYAIGSGGIIGKGLGNSIQKLGFVPEAQNDMIFTIICEELGIVGAVSVIALFVFMLWRFMIIANNAPDLFGSMVVVGVLSHIALQVVLNVAVVTNTIPNTGVTLPLISYGGTSVMFIMIELGIVLSVSRRIRYEE